MIPARPTRAATAINHHGLPSEDWLEPASGAPGSDSAGALSAEGAAFATAPESPFCLSFGCGCACAVTTTVSVTGATVVVVVSVTVGAGRRFVVVSVTCAVEVAVSVVVTLSSTVLVTTGVAAGLDTVERFDFVVVAWFGATRSVVGSNTTTGVSAVTVTVCVSRGCGALSYLISGVSVVLDVNVVTSVTTSCGKVDTTVVTTGVGTTVTVGGVDVTVAFTTEVGALAATVSSTVSVTVALGAKVVSVSLTVTGLASTVVVVREVSTFVVVDVTVSPTFSVTVTKGYSNLAFGVVAWVTTSVVGLGVTVFEVIDVTDAVSVAVTESVLVSVTRVVVWSVLTVVAVSVTTSVFTAVAVSVVVAVDTAGVVVEVDGTTSSSSQSLPPRSRIAWHTASYASRIPTPMLRSGRWPNSWRVSGSLCVRL